VVRLNQEDVSTPQQMRKLVQNEAPASQLQLQVYREGKPLSLKVTLQESPDSRVPSAAGKAGQAAPQIQQAAPMSPEEFGFQVADPSESLTATAPFIATILPGSIAHRSGLIPGDEILSVNRVQVKTFEDVPRVMRAEIKKSKKKPLIFEVRRAGIQKLFIAVHERAKLGA